MFLLLTCYILQQNLIDQSVVRMAERSKAPDLSSGTRMCAWVRTPLLTMVIFSQLSTVFNLKKILPQRGFEPRTFGLGIQRAIHCATRAGRSLKLDLNIDTSNRT